MESILKMMFYPEFSQRIADCRLCLFDLNYLKTTEEMIQLSIKYMKVSNSIRESYHQQLAEIYFYVMLCSNIFT